MRIRPRFVIGVGLMMAAVAYLITTAIRSTSEYYLTVNEAAPAVRIGRTEPRVAGRVKPGTIVGSLHAHAGVRHDDDPRVAAADGAVKPSRAPVAPSARFRRHRAGEPKPDMLADAT